MSSDLLQSLNPRQLQAVTAPEKSVLILAGAGSGKTRVLTTRIAWLLSEHKAQTGDILAVTFTNKAAKEMLVRLEAILPYDLRRMWVGTFHGLCNRILRTHAQDAGLPKTFQILDSSDQLSMVKRVMKALNIDTESYDPRQVANVINWYKENGMRASHAAGQQGGDETAVKVYQAYEQQCQREGVVDFAELLLRCYELLDRNEIVRSHYQNRFRHILVDEFQDTNVLQYRWLQMLAGFGRGPGGAPMNAVFAVGDDDQSIYAFRGANVGNMSDFLRDFGVEEPIRLEENYRSTGTILDAANALIAHNSNRLGKNLWTSGSRGDRICVAELDDDRAEAEWIAREIEADRSRGRAWRDHAILYRANAQSRALESAFAARGYSSVVVEVGKMEDVEFVVKKLQDMGYQTTNMKEYRDTAMRTVRMLELLLGGIGLISFLVAAIGISNTMTTAVYDRVAEIGTLKVLGCEKRELMAMILLEAGIYGLVGGACGVVLSLLFGKIINRIAVSALLLEAGTKIAVITPKIALSAVGMAMLLGTIAGYLPSRWAAKLSPLTAMRRD